MIKLDLIQKFTMKECPSCGTPSLCLHTEVCLTLTTPDLCYSRELDKDSRQPLVHVKMKSLGTEKTA